MCDSLCYQRLAAPRKVGPSLTDLPKDRLRLQVFSKGKDLIERECHHDAISIVSTKPLLAHRHEEATGVIAGQHAAERIQAVVQPRPEPVS